jgi:hypothetical protein
MIGVVARVTERETPTPKIDSAIAARSRVLSETASGVLTPSARVRGSYSH